MNEWDYEEDDDPCIDCGEYHCVCEGDDEPERCDECLLHAEWQCRTHAPAYLAACEAQQTEAEVTAALGTILAHAGAFSGSAWERLVDAARAVRREFENG